MSVKPIDNFIMNSVRLFEVNPSQTLFSISYKPPTPKRDTKVSFRTHNSHLSSNYRYTTNKSKDVSRLLSALGPRGVSITPGKIEKIAQLKKKQKNSTIKESGKKAKGKSIQDVVGLATLIVNTDVEKSDPAAKKTATGQKQNANAVQDSNSNSSASKKKKNKNKGKKKR
ncbi:signal recognition particle subunit SRP21 [Saccharomyces paradoxus]|uniref:Signal recognition particle subunit SRP21 n=1 Tax=Saccharomyces paradoxus TaxID=27291 RepID=A0A8B8UUW7_SACPA|nr:Srp21 [Saccharomyces paradoxus]QHS74476.1 Srp21 [Saccharomyces paradoxus]